MNKLLSVLCVTLLPAWVAGCGATHVPYHSGNEIPQGPGMFSGKEGAFVFSTDKKPDKPEAQQQSAGGTDAEYKEFRDYQEFKRWKETSRDTPEYREFREWQEWKAYRAWKKDGS